VDAQKNGVWVLCVYIIFIGDGNRSTYYYFQEMVEDMGCDAQKLEEGVTIVQDIL